MLTRLIEQNPTLGQEELAVLASKQGIARDQAIAILKNGIGKHWRVDKGRYNKSTYWLL